MSRLGQTRRSERKSPEMAWVAQLELPSIVSDSRVSDRSIHLESALLPLSWISVQIGTIRTIVLPLGVFFCGVGKECQENPMLA
jgi:hypothetical protein